MSLALVPMTLNLRANTKNRRRTNPPAEFPHRRTSVQTEPSSHGCKCLLPRTPPLPVTVPSDRGHRTCERSRSQLAVEELLVNRQSPSHLTSSRRSPSSTKPQRAPTPTASEPRSDEVLLETLSEKCDPWLLYTLSRMIVYKTSITRRFRSCTVVKRLLNLPALNLAAN